MQIGIAYSDPVQQVWLRIEVAEGGSPDALDYDIYPKELWPPYRDYRFQLAEQMYATMGIGRQDKPRRLQWFARNYEFFGAPLALMCSIDRGMGPPHRACTHAPSSSGAWRPPISTSSAARSGATAQASAATRTHA